MAVDEEYIKSLSIEELQRELKYTLEVQYGILFALRDTPEFPSAFVLMHLGGSRARNRKYWERGKELQRIYGSTVIPFKSECEYGAGLWEAIRKGIQNG